MGSSTRSTVGKNKISHRMRPDDELESEVMEFFQTYRLKRAPRSSTCTRIMWYVLWGNRVRGITAARRADIVRQLQIEWNGHRVSYVDGLRTGTVLYVVPDVAQHPGGRPMFEAMVRWDESINRAVKKMASMVGLATLKRL